LRFFEVRFEAINGAFFLTTAAYELDDF